MMPYSPEQLCRVVATRWLWSISCHGYHPTIVAVRCEQLVLNGAWRLPRVVA